MTLEPFRTSPSSIPPSLRGTRKIAALILGLAIAGAAAYVVRSRTSVTVPPSAIADGERRVVARIGDTVITEADFLAAWRKRSPSTQEEVAGQVSTVLEDLVRHELLFAEATRTRFIEREDVRTAWKALVVRRFLDDRSSSTNATKDIDDAAIADYLRENAAKFTSPERRRLAVITFSKPPTATPERDAEREQEVVRIRDQAVAEQASTRDFGGLASRHSSHPGSRRNGGDVGWLTRAQAERAWPAAVVETAFALSDPGEVGPLVSTEEGRYLVKLIERQEGRLASLESVRERIRRELMRTREEQAEASMLSEIRSRHRVETHPERLRSSDLSVASPEQTLAQRPPSIPTP